MAHIFVGSAAPWYPIPEDGLPRHLLPALSSGDERP